MIKRSLLLLLLFFTPFAAQANGHVLVLDDVAHAEILPGWRTSKGTHMAAIRIQLAEGWHTYWRAPGAAGIPPQFNWQDSGNLQSVSTHWPTPVVFDQAGSLSIGYEHEVIIPIELTPNSDGEITLRGEMNIGVCDEICLPMNIKLNANLPNAGSVNPQISASLVDHPKVHKSGASCSISPIADGLKLTTQIKVASLGSMEVVVVELPDKAIWVSEAKTTRDGQVLTSSVEMVPPNAAPFALQRSDIRITVLGSEKAVEFQGCVAG